VIARDPQQDTPQTYRVAAGELVERLAISRLSERDEIVVLEGLEPS